MKISKTSKLYILIATICIVGIIIDLLTKHFSTGIQMNLINGVISIYYTLNTGAGWSIFADQTLFLTIFSAIMVTGIIILLIFYKPKSKFFSISIALILSGAIGNLIDRVFIGAVRDFISLDFINFPIFNFADTMLTIGAISLAIYLIFFTTKKEKTNEPKQS